MTVVIQASSISRIKIKGPDSDQASENSLLINFLHRLLAPGMSIANPARPLAINVVLVL